MDDRYEHIARIPLDCGHKGELRFPGADAAAPITCDRCGAITQLSEADASTITESYARERDRGLVINHDGSQNRP